MDRRSFLKASIALGSSGVMANEGAARALAGFAGPSPSTEPPLPDSAVVEGLIRNMDQRMAWIDRQQEFPPELRITPRLTSPHETMKLEQQGRLFRQSLRTLYMTGRFMDLPDEIKVHPHIQARVAAAQPEMDTAVLGMTDMLEALQPEDHRRIQSNLKRYPIGERLAVLLDQTTKEDDFPTNRRLDTHASTLELAQRMAAQSPALTIDPYVDRVRKIVAHPRTAGENERILAARVGEKVFWEDQQRLVRLHSQWEKRLEQATPLYNPEQVDSSGVALPDTSSTPKKKVSTGGLMMGYGAASIGVGLFFAGLYALGVEFAAVPAVILGITVGPILLLVGLIVVIAS